MRIDEALRYHNTAQWLLGYIETLDPKRYSELIHRMKTAADLLDAIWEQEKEKS